MITSKMPKPCYYCNEPSNTENYTYTPYEGSIKDICNSCYKIRCYHCLQIADILTDVQIKSIDGYKIAKNKEELESMESLEHERIEANPYSAYSLQTIIILPEYLKICIKCLWHNLKNKYPRHATYKHFHLTGLTNADYSDPYNTEKLFEHIYNDFYIYKQQTTKYIEQLTSTITSLENQQSYKNTTESLLLTENPQQYANDEITIQLDKNIRSKFLFLKETDNEIINNIKEILTTSINQQYDELYKNLPDIIQKLQETKKLLSSVGLTSSVDNIDKEIKKYTSLLTTWKD